MGSATREALSESLRELDSTGTVGDNGSGRDLTTVSELFAVGRVVARTAHLRSALSDKAAPAEVKRQLVQTVFGSSVSERTLRLVSAAAAGRWSDEDGFVAGLEELGIRAAVQSVGSDVSIEQELFEFGRYVASDAELELALGSKLGDVQAKVALVESLLAGKASPQTVEIVRQLVQQPRGRRIRTLLRYAAGIAADQSNLTVATVTAAAPLTEGQLARLRAGLSSLYGRDVKINVIVDASIMGGLRVQVGDDVIDGSVASRLHDLKLQLAG